MKYWLSILCLLFVVGTAHAQVDPLFTQYQQSQLLYNPAAAGATGGLKTTALFRSQWAKVEGAPTTIGITFDNLARNTKHAYGGSLLSDSYGPVNEYGIFGTYAFRIKAGKGHFAIGAQGGVQLYQTQWADLTAVQAGDVTYTNLSNGATVANFGTGLYYSNDKLSAGIGIPHLFNNKLYKSNENFLANHYYAHVDYRFNIKADKLALQPALLLKYAAKANAQVDFTANFIIVRDVTVGLGYRSDNSANFKFQYQYNLDRMAFRIGYSYDLANSNYRSTTGGAHEILLTFLLKKAPKPETPAIEPAAE